MKNVASEWLQKLVKGLRGFIDEEWFHHLKHFYLRGTDYDATGIKSLQSTWSRVHVSEMCL